jgi:ABC-2 type transport system ATP-binding protein
MSQVEGRIVVSGLTKQFKKVRAVDNLSFTVEPGTVTGFLGPNGAGKTTTLRMLLGLIRPTSGTATIGGVRYQDLPDPLRVVGAALEASSFHEGRTGRNHLRVLCAAAGIDYRRADEVLEMVGMSAAVNRKVRGYSLGMRQRLGLAATLLGDPQVLILDEPAHGLDPEGIRWLRGFLRSLAAQGRTILVSSHLLAEVEQTVDEVVIIAGGKSVRQGKVSDLRSEQRVAVRVRTPQPAELIAAMPLAKVRRSDTPELFHVDGVEAAYVGKVAHEARVELHELTTEHSDLEDIFMELTSGKAVIR